MRYGASSSIICDRLSPRQLAEDGLAVLVVSSEMPEIMGVCHRILTVADGRITSELSEDEFREDRLIEGAMAWEPALV
jgi:ABC-type sugar transport system ATPase subunit